MNEVNQLHYQSSRQKNQKLKHTSYGGFEL